MTRSTNHPDADYTPNDIGPREVTNHHVFEDLERTEEYWEKMQDVINDEVM